MGREDMTRGVISAGNKMLDKYEREQTLGLKEREGKLTEEETRELKDLRGHGKINAVKPLSAAAPESAVNRMRKPL